MEVVTPPAAAAPAPSPTPEPTPNPAAAAPPSASPTPPSPAPPSPSPAPNNWIEALPQDRKDFVANKGFKEPSDLLESYINLEKLRIGLRRCGV